MKGQGPTTDPGVTVSRQGAREFVDVLSEEFAALHPGVANIGRSLGELYSAVHRLDPPQSALCLSGGGIRSASFALGVLQALAWHGLLFRLRLPLYGFGRRIYWQLAIGLAPSCGG